MKDTYDIELVRRTCEGDMTAFHQIVDTYKKKVYYIAYNICGDHHEAEDISQEVFIKVFKSIKKFRKDAKFSSWLYQVSVNTSIDAIRKVKKKQDSMETAQIDTLHPETSATGARATNPETQAANDLMRQKVQQALPVLSKKERAAFVMRYFNGFKVSEIADMMEVSINSIKTMLLRAKKKLRKKLAPYHHEFGWNTTPEANHE